MLEMQVETLKWQATRAADQAYWDGLDEAELAVERVKAYKADLAKAGAVWMAEFSD